MKLSIAWIFDHIDADWHSIDIAHLIDLLNQKTAEIEAYYPVSLDLDRFTLAQVKKITDDHVELFSPEWHKTMHVPHRQDAKVDDWFMIKKNGQDYAWASGVDVGNKKNGILPALYCEDDTCAGRWKQHVAATDYIIEVDNKSITHRPDLWGHRGMAREVALLLDLPFKPLEQVVTTLPVKEFAQEAQADETQPFSINIHDLERIKRFAVAYIAPIENKPSLPWMAIRLSKIEQRPLDLLVDVTNYVMLDIGQPIHAFDADYLTSKRIEPRMAMQKEKITLLDDDTLELSKEDIVITDGSRPIALGGIMGGKESGVTRATKAMVLESANFDATTIRRSATRLKKRTEASTRFEKTLDPNQNIAAIERFVRLLQDSGISFDVSDIYSVGAQAEDKKVTISHAFIETHLGTSIDPAFIERVLTTLGFTVKKEGQGELVYHVTVPTFRATKDIEIKEDILEEVARLYGYSNIPLVLPNKETKPSDLQVIQRIRQIKRQLAFGFDMREVCNYAFFDEDFLRELQWEPEQAVSIKNPLSHLWRRLVTSLIPDLLRGIGQNQADYDRLRFFEWGRIWRYEGTSIVESSSLAGIIYDKKRPIDFYDGKALIQQMAAMLHLPLTWHKIDAPSEPWFVPYQTARLMHDDQVIGTAGIINESFTRSVFPGHAFAFVCDGGFLVRYKQADVRLKPLPKYQEVERDISMLVPLSVTVEQVTKTIRSCSDLIRRVSLTDFYQKDDWLDKKSLTFRCVLRDDNKTLTKQEVDTIWTKIVQAMEKLGAEIR